MNFNSIYLYVMIKKKIQENINCLAKAGDIFIERVCFTTL